VLGVSPPALQEVLKFMRGRVGITNMKWRGDLKLSGATKRGGSRLSKLPSRAKRRLASNQETIRSGPRLVKKGCSYDERGHWGGGFG